MDVEIPQHFLFDDIHVTQTTFLVDKLFQRLLSLDLVHLPS
jgi:hypothetical protein